jgi:hypothetical protein
MHHLILCGALAGHCRCCYLSYQKTDKCGLVASQTFEGDLPPLILLIIISLAGLVYRSQ